MKKRILWIALLVCVLALGGCGGRNTYKIGITVPAGSEEGFYYSQEQIAATGDEISLYCAEGLGDTLVILEPVDEWITPGYVATYMTPGLRVSFDASGEEWFVIGVTAENDTDTDKTVYVSVTGVQVRIP